KKTMIKVQLSIINNEQMNKINTKFNTWQGYCKYLDEKIDKVEIRLNAKIDEIKEQMVTKEELKLVKDEIMSSVAIQIQSLKETIKEEIMSSVTIQIQSLKETIKDEIASVIKTEIKGLRN
ncbi:MAG: hypothetical protein LBS95_02980, partial [Mycoplasmataceae bacterium]|nr:hypothetical protein [Mycoplasmataceae bacterium]